MIAAKRDNVDIVKLLVLKGANQELKNKEGKAVADIAGSFSKSMFNQVGYNLIFKTKGFSQRNHITNIGWRSNLTNCSRGCRL